VPIGVHFRVAAEGLDWEVFSVVADPVSGKAVRVYHRAAQTGAEAAALGRLVARELIEAGAGPLLAACEGLR
jgi:hypothetical protein